LRKAAMTVGALPVRTWEASSAKVTSRTQCRPFSIVQWPRSGSARRAGRACSNGRLVKDEDVARLSPLGHAHINFLGRYAITASAPAQGLRQLGQVPDLPGTAS
jgi:hypothetical protein